MAKLIGSVAIVVAFTAVSCSKNDDIKPALDSQPIAKVGQNQANAASYGQVTSSNGTWTTKVDGVTRYTGAKFFDAVNAAINNMTSGTVNILNSGSSGPGTGNVYAIKLKSNITLDFHNTTVHCNGDAFIVPVLCDNSSNVKVMNMKITGNPRYALWFRTNNGVTLSGININTTGGLGIRIDDSRGGWTYNVDIGSPIVNGPTAQAVETYGVDGFKAGVVTANGSAGCGLLLNKTKNATIGTVNATNCCYGGGYAGFRIANNAGPNITVGTVNSTRCGRGFFSVTSSNGCTIGSLNAKDCSGHGALLENAQRIRINGGSIMNNGAEGVRFSTTLSYICRDNVISNVSTNDGIRETAPSDYNTVTNCRMNGSALTLVGPHSTSSGITR